MNIKVINLGGLMASTLGTADRPTCVAAVFRDDYSACSNKAVKVKGKWALCAPHGRLDEVEIVVDNDPDSVL